MNAPNASKTGIAIVGCGFVADFYAQTLVNHPGLTVAGVYDRDEKRRRAFNETYGFATYGSLDELLDDPRVEIVVNLTNPRSHYEVSRACLEAGRHVYSEKPLAETLDQARELVQLAKDRGLQLNSAPCSHLGEAAQTLARALADDLVGPVRLVYADLDDGMIHRRGFRGWRTRSGATWPAKDEFETGCTFEHAGYYLTWLSSFFGPARKITAFSSCQVKEKGPDLGVENMAPDFSVGCLEYDDGVVARLTCSILTPINRSITISGEDGDLYVPEAWDYAAPVYFRDRRRTLWQRISKRLGKPHGVRLKPVRKADFVRAQGSHPMDFARGPAELAAAIAEGRPSRLSADLSLHVVEATIALQHPERLERPYSMTSAFDRVPLMPWARHD